MSLNHFFLKCCGAKELFSECDSTSILVCLTPCLHVCNSSELTLPNFSILDTVLVCLAAAVVSASTPGSEGGSKEALLKIAREYRYVYVTCVNRKAENPA